MTNRYLRVVASTQAEGAVKQHAVIQRRANKQWVTPNEDQIKVKHDAALDEATQTTGLGGIFRDSRGEVLVTFCSKLDLQHLLRPKH